MGLSEGKDHEKISIYLQNFDPYGNNYAGRVYGWADKNAANILKS